MNKNQTKPEVELRKRVRDVLVNIRRRNGTATPDVIREALGEVVANSGISIKKAQSAHQAHGRGMDNYRVPARYEITHEGNVVGSVHAEKQGYMEKANWKVDKKTDRGWVPVREDLPSRDAAFEFAQKHFASAQSKSALIVVDAQNDFMPGGSLAVPKGDEVVKPINDLMSKFPVVVATQDWHPKDHGSFASAHPGKKVFDQTDLNGLPQTLWPDHTVQGSTGAEFHPGLDASRIQKVFQKGTDPKVDSYSGFFDNGGKNPSGMADYLRGKGVTNVYVAGLATDYCVKATAIDAARLGFTTHLVDDASRGVGITPADVPNAIADMARAGVSVVQSEDVPDFTKASTTTGGDCTRTSDGKFGSGNRCQIKNSFTAAVDRWAEVQS